jgi:alkylated DNA repair dioxygenase AlkB
MSIASFFSKFSKPVNKPTETTPQEHDGFDKITLSENSYILSGKIPIDIIPDFEEMMELKPQLPDTIMMLGKVVLTPRFVSHYLKSYYYTGRTHEALPLPNVLDPLLEWANKHLVFEGNPLFNQVLLNFYLNGSQYIGKHSDDERPMVPGSPIFSASFGQVRVFRIRDKKDDSIVQEITMEDGTFILMCGNMQKEFKHEVPKVMGKKGEDMKPRINVTFRAFK